MSTALRGRRAATGVAALSVLLAALDAYVVVTILVTVVRDLGVPIDRLQRATPVVTGYLLGYVAAMPLLGQLSDRLGRRELIETCLATFAAGSVISAVAPGIAVLVAGRLVQGAAGGALLPVTFALVGDLWEARGRALPLGVVGAAQELGSVIGPLYGAGVAAAIGWRGLFWLNVPIAVASIAAVRALLPRAQAHRGPRPVDVVGGILLAIGLGALVVGLYNPRPADGALAPWGPAAIGAGLAAVLAFGIWEARARTPLFEPGTVDALPFAGSLAASFLSGAALLVTLVDVPLMAQTQFGTDATGGALILTRFLVALPLGAVVGGVLATRFGDRAVGAAGLALGALGFWLVAGWPLHALSARYDVGPVSLPRLDLDLLVAGVGLGVAISPIASAALRVSRPDRHGSASAAVVVSRMVGMLVGVAGLTAWGLHRFAELTARLRTPLPFGVPTGRFQHALTAYDAAVRAALHVEYREIFVATAAICAAAAAVFFATVPRRRDARLV